MKQHATKLSAILFILSFFKLICCNNIFEHVNTSKKEIPELAYLNKSVDPCENFYQFTCGNFKNIQPIPDDKNIHIWDHFEIVQKDLHELAQDILVSRWPGNGPKADSKAFRKARAFYKACTDTVQADKLMLRHLKEISREFGVWPAIVNGPFKGRFSWNELGHMMAEYGLQFFFTMQVIPNNFNGSENVILLQEDVLSNPANIRVNFEEDLDEKLRRLFSGETRDNLKPVHVFLNKIAFKLRDVMGTFKPNHDISDEIAETVEFMGNISKKGIIEENAEITPFINRTITIRQLQEWTFKHFGDDLHLNWLTFLQNVFKYSGAKLNSDTKLMPISAINTYGILNLIRQTTDKTLYNFIFARLFTYMAPDSGTYMREAFHEFYEKLELPVYKREKYCIRKILGYSGNIDLSYAVTYQYKKYYFNINILQEAQYLINDLRASIKEIVMCNTWMDAESKQKALIKAENMLTLLGFPEDAATAENVDNYYRNLRISKTDHGSNAKSLRAFRMAQNYGQIESGRQRNKWTFSPLEVNAVYNRPNNIMLLPISMLNSIFMGDEISSLDYGRLGSIIGHEITHGFDDSGRMYDEHGNMVNWWTAETQAAYKDRVQCFKDQYGAYYIEEIDQFVDSTTTLNENIADNGGLHEAYRAFKKTQNRRDFKPIDGYTVEQLFFIGYGTMWCAQESNYYLSEIQAKSGYAPGRYRVIGAISNMAEFAEAFRCQPNAPMNPRSKCKLW